MLSTGIRFQSLDVIRKFLVDGGMVSEDRIQDVLTLSRTVTPDCDCSNCERTKQIIIDEAKSDDDILSNFENIKPDPNSPWVIN